MATTIKENVFTKDIFFPKEEKYSAVKKGKKFEKKKDVDSTDLPSRNYGASRGSSQTVIGNDFRYKGDIEITENTPLNDMLDYFDSLPYQMSGMDIVIREKLEKWNPNGKGSAEEAKRCISMLKWDREELVKDLKRWKQ